MYTLPLSDHAIAANVSDGSLNSATRPAVPGEYVVLYLTGQGAVAPRVDTGDAAPARVAFAGLSPGFVGILQVNLEVPAVDACEQLLDVAVGGVKSNRTVLSVKSR